MASLDNRLATHVVQLQWILKGIKPELCPNTLTVVSIDSILISCIHMQWCLVWMQHVVGMVPQCSVYSPYLHQSPCEILHASNTSRKHVASSPIPLPIPIERCKRRRQTLTELASPHTNMASPVGLLSHCGELSLDDIDATDHPSSRPNISLTNFLPTA